MSRFDASTAVWGGGFFGYFAIMELIPVFWAGCPWTTLSSWTKDVELHWVWAAFFICIGLWILNAHLTWRFLPKLWREITG